MNKLKLLILTNKIPDYRIPVFHKLSEIYDLTVAHFDKFDGPINYRFKTIKFTPVKIFKFILFFRNIHNIASNFNAVIAWNNIRVPQYVALGFKSKRKFALTYWNIGVSASYSSPFDYDKRFDKFKFYLWDKADSLVFYTNYPIKRYINDGKLNPQKLFVANNTIEINQKIEIQRVKKYFLFVGSFYKSKKIFDLLEAYLLAHSKYEKLQRLYLIGEGKDKVNIQKWIIEKKLTEKIILLGAIYDTELLKNHFQNSIACISPGQAGLTVLTSLAYGVPFVTSKNAITGGEIFNIINEYNGIIYDGNVTTLSEIILDFSNDNLKVHRLGKNAQDYYFSNCTIDIMIKGLIDSVNYALFLKNL